MKKTIFLGLICLAGFNIVAQGVCLLSCPQNINASMPTTECIKGFVARDFIPNLSCEATVSIIHPFGTNQNLASNYVDRSHLGHTMIYNIESTQGGKCWGYVTIEDKMAPDGGCKDREVSCFELIEINKIVENVVDNCSDQASAVITIQTFEDFGCDDQGKIGIVHRTIRTIDGWGNSTTCSDNITIKRVSIDGASCADMIKIDCSAICFKVLADGMVSEQPTTIKFSSDPKDPAYPTPDLLLSLQNAKKWRDPDHPDLPCLDASILTVPSLCDNRALDFDGSDDLIYRYLDVNEDEFTVEFWFKTTNQNTGMFCVRSDDGGHDRHVFLTNGNVCTRVYSNETIHTSGINYADGKWHHVAYVLGSSINGNRIYMDGALQASGSKSFSDFDWQNLIIIGYSDDASNQYFQGQMDEIRIWSVARTESEIKVNMKKELAPQTNLQVYYKFNEGRPSQDNTGLTPEVIDASGNNLSAGLIGFNQSGTSSNWVDGNGFSNFNCTPMFPGLGGYCKTSVSYKDEILPTCGTGAFKIRREWLIVDWCTGKEKVCPQYIVIEDTSAPKLVSENGGTTPRDNRREYTVYAGAHDCTAFADLLAFTLDDCSQVTQSYSLSYTENNTVKVLSGTLPGRIDLPPIPGIYGVRCFDVDVTLTDVCYHITKSSIHVCAIDDTPPNPVCDEDTRATVDPATCWARIYAIDLDNGSRDNCCNVLHFAIARMDSINAARKYVIDAVVAQCGNASYWASKDYYDNYAEDYINSYIFKDYLDLTECGTIQVVLRVWEACGIPRFDPHVWPCSEHQWFLYNLGRFRSHYRADHNLNFGFSKNANYTLFKAPKDCNWRYPLIFCDPLLAPWFKQAGLDDNLPYYSGAADDDICNFNYYDPRIGNNKSADVFGKNPPGNTCSRFNYNSCMVNVTVDDKTPPVCEKPIDLTFYCDNIVSEDPDDDEYEFARNACSITTLGISYNYTNYSCTDYNQNPYNQVECVKENDADASDTLDGVGKTFGWYGCNIYGAAGHVDEHGAPVPSCPIAGPREHMDQSESYNGAHSWIPIYCHTWLCLDATDQGGKINPGTYFYTPLLRSGGRGKDLPAGSKQFIIWDNCWLNESSLSQKDASYFDQCGNGWIQRTWTVNDKCGLSVTCSQKIITKHRSDFEVMFPSDVKTTCDSDSNLSPTATGRPMVMDDECELVGVNYVDQRFDIVPDACYKIVRTWTLVDWCKYDPNQRERDPEVIIDDRAVADPVSRFCIYRKLKDDGDGYMTYTQIIKVVDTIAPAISCTSDTFCINDGYSGKGDEPTPMCTVPSGYRKTFTAHDNCTSDNLLAYRYEIYKGSSLVRKTGPNQGSSYLAIANDLTPGLNTIVAIVSDKCGQEDTATCTVLVKDCKKPTPYCYNGIATVIMPTSGSITVWAKDLDAGSYDNCTVKANLVISFDKEGTALSRTFTCDSIPDGVAATKPVNIYVKDEAGNVDFCSTYLLIQDGSGNKCPDKAGLAANVGGKVVTEVNDPIEHASVELKTSIPMPLYNTDERGSFAFNGLPINSDIILTPSLDADPMNGISTVDLVLIQKHLLGTELITSPYKLIAADVDKSNDINSIDLVELRKLILTIYDKMPNTPSWRFIPKSYVFPDAGSPWGFPEQVEIKGLSKDEMNNDFIGIKIGDVNGTVVSHHLLGAEIRSEGTPLVFRTQDRQLNAGEEAFIEFTADNFNQIEGYQFSMAANGLEIKEVKPGLLKISEGNFGLRHISQGYLTTSWNQSRSGAGVKALANDLLFSLKVKATKPLKLSDVLFINSKYTRAEAYNGVNTLGVTLTVGNKTDLGYALNQNTPNPFKTYSLISYSLPRAERATIKITDVTGRVIRTYTQDGIKGTNELKLNRNDLAAGSGVMYYTLETKNFSATKKLVIVD